MCHNPDFWLSGCAENYSNFKISQRRSSIALIKMFGKEMISNDFRGKKIKITTNIGEIWFGTWEHFQNVKKFWTKI
jgi:hypothetical protein